MAFTTTVMPTSFKGQILRAVHNFATGGSTFKLALYDNSASFTAATTAYTTTNEVGASGSYAAGGGTLTKLGVTTTGTTAITDFSDLSFTTATITAYGALIYNDTATGNPAVAVLNFGGAKTSTAGTFTIVFSAAMATGAIIRIA